MDKKFMVSPCELFVLARNPDAAVRMLRWEMITPLGTPVLTLVYMIIAISLTRGGSSICEGNLSVRFQCLTVGIQRS